MKKTLTVLGSALLACASFFIPSEANAAPYIPISVNVSFDDQNDIAHFETVIQDGQNQLNRFTIHRAVKVNHNNHLPLLNTKPVVLLPAGGSTFRTYETGTPGSSMVDTLALNGYDVFGYSPRSSNIPTNHCDNNDCSVMANWGLATYLEDIEVVTALARTLHFGQKPAVGGWSLGGLLGLAVVNQHPNHYSGLILIDALIRINNPDLQTIFNAQCAEAQVWLNNGIVFDNQSLPFQTAAVNLGVLDPTTQSPFEPSLTNEQFMYAFTTTPVDPPLGEVFGYTYNAGSIVGWTVANPQRELGVANNLFVYDPIAVYRDYKCAFGGAGTFTSNLGSFTGKVISFQAGLALGGLAEDTLALMPQTQITRIVKSDFGHIDFIADQNYQTNMMTPMLTWLSTL